MISGLGSWKAHENIGLLLKKSTRNIFFDTHPPFQIDGNFDASAGKTEMLIQSHAEQIDLLHALMKAWPNRSVKGLCPRGGFEVDTESDSESENGVLTAATLRSKLGNTCTVHFGDKTKTLNTDVNGRCDLMPPLETALKIYDKLHPLEPSFTEPRARSPREKVAQ